MASKLSESDRLAARGISLLTDALARDFGITLKTGAEQEYFCFDKYEKYENDPLNLRYRDYGAYENNPQPAVYYEKTRKVLRHYKEAGDNQYEIALAHEAYASPLELCEGIIARRIGLQKRAARVPHLHLTFDPVDERYEHIVESNSLQFMVSFEQNGQSVFGRWGGDKHKDKRPRSEQNRATHFENLALEQMKDCSLLLVGSEKAFKRFGAKTEYGLPPADFVGRFRGKVDLGNPGFYWRNDHDAFEFRMPSSDASPYQAMLMLLSGMYLAIKRDPSVLQADEVSFAKGKKGKLPINAGPVAKDAETALHQFKTATSIEDLLNALSDTDRLGTEWKTATSNEYDLKRGSKGTTHSEARQK